jgi:hypothetical protein
VAVAKSRIDRLHEAFRDDSPEKRRRAFLRRKKVNEELGEVAAEEIAQRERVPKEEES